MDIERQPYQKVILCLLAAMAVIFAIWTAVSHNHEGVAFHDTLLTVSQQGSATVYSGKLYYTPVTITFREENGTKLVNFSADGAYYAACRIEFPEGAIQTEYGAEIPRIRVIRDEEVLFSGGYDPAADSPYRKYFDEDGSWYVPVSVHASGYGDPWHYFNFDMYDILRFSETPELSYRGSWLSYFGALFLSLLIALLVVFPETTFYISHCLSVKDPEPTDFYYFTHKLGSIVSAVVVLIIYLIGVNTIV